MLDYEEIGIKKVSISIKLMCLYLVIQDSYCWHFNIHWNKILVESVQMILKIAISNICFDQIHKVIHTWKLYMSKLISEK